MGMLMAKKKLNKGKKPEWLKNKEAEVEKKQAEKAAQEKAPAGEEASAESDK